MMIKLQVALFLYQFSSGLLFKVTLTGEFENHELKYASNTNSNSVPFWINECELSEHLLFLCYIYYI